MRLLYLRGGDWRSWTGAFGPESVNSEATPEQHECGCQDPAQASSFLSASEARLSLGRGRGVGGTDT